MKKSNLVKINIHRATVKGLKFPQYTTSIFGRDYFVSFGRDMHEAVDALDDGDYVFTADPANVFIAPQTDSDRWVKVVITDADVI